MALGDQIRRARLAKGLSQKAIAAHFKISRVAVALWENGTTRPDLGKMTKLAGLLDIGLKDGQILGMVFAVQLSRQKHRRKVMLGASGRPANDAIVASGLSAILHCNLTHQAMCDTHD